MKRIITTILFIITLAAIGSHAADYKYRIWLTDKDASEYSTAQPEQFLSQECIDRRNRHGIAIGINDLPVCKQYIEQIEALGCQSVVTSRWMNTLVVALDDTTLVQEIDALPFVAKTECVWKNATANNSQRKQKCEPVNQAPQKDNSSNYSLSWLQTSVLNADKLHDAGFRGNGMTIAVLDGGFYGVENSTLFDLDRITLLRDFPHNSMTHSMDTHGTQVLSCMAIDNPGNYIGTAPEANFVLMVTEDVDSEYPVEEDYWVAGVELADSIGVDIINTSLGYFTFDDSSMNYTQDDLDGKTAFSSRAANIAAQKGLLLVIAAGNEYNKEWNKITFPADAEGILTVGSVTYSGGHSSFSGCGPTADNRIKPDVMSMGTNACTVTAGDVTTLGSGTSFATPILCGAIACLWQAYPQWSAEELIEVVKQNSSQHDSPDELLGYGIPDIYAAYLNNSSVEGNSLSPLSIYYNNGMLHLPTSLEASTLTIYDTMGRIVMQQEVAKSSASIDLHHLDGGIYIAVWQNAYEYRAVKIMK